MWSTLKVIVTDADTFVPPADIPLYIHPSDQYRGICLATKQPSEKFDTNWFMQMDPNVDLWYKYEDYKKNPESNFVIAEGDADIIFRFRTLDFHDFKSGNSGNFKNGKVYTLRGKLGEGYVGVPSFEVSFTDFVEEDLEFGMD